MTSPYKTIVKLRTLSADEKTKQEAYYREKRLHDEASALSTAWSEGYAEGYAEGFEIGYAEGLAERKSELIEKWRKMGIPEEEIRELLL